MTYVITRQAKKEMSEIWKYIADNNPEAADRTIKALIQRMDLLADMPFLGKARPDLHSEYRAFPVEKYIIFYRIAEDHIYIAHVLHGSRDIPQNIHDA